MLVIMAIISILVYSVSTSSILMFNKVHYSDIMNNAQEKMTSIMNKVEVSSENIIDELTWHLSSPEQVISTLQYELETNRHLYGCALGFIPDYFPKQGRWFEPYALNKGDEITVKDIGSEVHDYINSEWYKKGIESKKGVWSSPYYDIDGGGTILCTHSRQVFTPEGKLAGVFALDVSLNELYTLIMENFKKENEGSLLHYLTKKDTGFQIYGFILGPDGGYIVHPDMERVLKTNYYDYAVGKDAEKYRKLGDDMRAGKTGEEDVVIDGIKSHVYYSPIMNSGWSMGVVVPTKSLYIPAHLLSTIIVILILLGLFIISLVCHHTIQKATKPLNQLAKSTEEIAKGKFDTILPEIKTNDEIHHLRDSFDDMQKSLSLYVKELTETTAQKASMESELEVARNIQMSMLPMIWPAYPDRHDLDVYGCVIPAKAVGGDLYDFHIRNEKFIFCIGDVSGKGIPASLVMSVVRSMFRTLSASEDNPARIISSISSSLAERNENLMFVTFFTGALDLSTGELLFSNAGHNAPMIVSNGKAHMLEVDPNVPMGIMPDWEYTLQSTKLSPGSTFILYTDGLTEATRNDGELFEEERVLEYLSNLDENISAHGLITGLIDVVNKFVEDAEQSDDLTMLSLIYNPVENSTEQKAEE